MLGPSGAAERCGTAVTDQDVWIAGGKTHRLRGDRPCNDVCVHGRYSVQRHLRTPQHQRQRKRVVDVAADVRIEDDAVLGHAGLHATCYCTMPFVSRMNAVSRFTSSSFSSVSLNPFCTSRCGMNV